MADRTLANVLDDVNIHSGDTNTVNPGVDSPTKRKLINEWYQYFKTVFGIDVTNKTSAALAQGDTVVATLTTTDAQLQLYRAVESTTNRPLEIISVQEALKLQEDDPTQGTVRKLGIEQLGGSVLFWSLYPYPIPSGATGVSLYFQDPANELATDGSADSTVLRVTKFEARAIGRLAAADVARLLARDSTFIEGIMRPIQGYMQALDALRTTRLRPRPDPEKVAP